MASGEERTQDQLAKDGRRLRLLAQLYPGYRLNRHVDRHGRVWWWAVRLSMTDELRAAGVHQSLGRTSFDDLQAALVQQDWITHMRQDWTGPERGRS
ncbi:hypothetical protein OHA25_08405 [Nonomuraea sp. NBC_00507]|uniref:hypothetical protein n=1 Tax=Nonomuraea sp. NBC_00507 TaxID=2976002 RepID=UPI002E189E6F